MNRIVVATISAILISLVGVSVEGQSPPGALYCRICHQFFSTDSSYIAHMCSAHNQGCNRNAGGYNPPSAHLIRKDGWWYPADGYTWVVNPPPPGDLRVEWVPNRRSKDHPHVVSGEVDNSWNPEDGYDWVSVVQGDFRVRWVPEKPSKIYSHVVSSDQEDRWLPEAGYTWVVNPPGADLRVVEDGQVETAIKAATVVVSLNEQKNRLEELSGLQHYDKVETALEILATRCVITMPLAASSAQREILIKHAKAELKDLLKQVLQSSVKQMSNDITNLTPFVWDPFAAKKRQALARIDRDIRDLKQQGTNEIDEGTIFREFRSGSEQSALWYNSGQALRQLLEINNKRDWAKSL